MIGAAWQRRGWWALLLLLTHAAMALDPQRSLDHYGHQVWRTDSGLPQNTVHSMLQSRDGYLWLGTDGGLVRFDGVEFVTFDTENTPQLASDIVYDLFQDDSGTLWISTGAGLVSYAGDAFAAYSRAQGLPADTVWFSYEDHHHRLWAITSAGPAFFNGKSFAQVAGAESAGPLTRSGLAEDDQGTLWLGGSSGVLALDIRPSVPRLARRLLSGIEVEAYRLQFLAKMTGEEGGGGDAEADALGESPSAAPSRQSWSAWVAAARGRPLPLGLSQGCAALPTSA